MKANFTSGQYVCFNAITIAYSIHQWLRIWGEKTGVHSIIKYIYYCEIHCFAKCTHSKASDRKGHYSTPRRWRCHSVCSTMASCPHLDFCTQRHTQCICIYFFRTTLILMLKYVTFLGHGPLKYEAFKQVV